MRRLIIFLLFLVASVWFGLEIVRHPGFLLIVYQPWMIQMPLWFALLGTLIFLGLFYILVTSLDHCYLLWIRFKNWLRFRREHKSYSKTQHGLMELIEERWKKAERLLLSGMNESVEPLLNYLGAAKAAHEQGAFDRRDQYIQKAYQIDTYAALAIGIVQAELEMQQGQLEQATAILTHLHAQAPSHPRVLKLLEKMYVRLGDWKNLQSLLPRLRKAKVLTTEQAELFQRNIYCEILRAAPNKSVEELHHIWDHMPRHVRKNPEVVHVYVNHLLPLNEYKEIEGLIRQTLKNDWQAELVNIYGTLPFVNLNRQLVIVGAWVDLYGPRPELLLTLGRLCIRVQLWGKAKDYFEKCLAQGPNPGAVLEYGMLLEQLGDTEASMRIYRNGLSAMK